jgi:hypothetical protein
MKISGLNKNFKKYGTKINVRIAQMERQER